MNARKSLLILINRVIGAGFGLIALAFIGRYMDPAAYGKVGFAIALLGVVGVLGNMGLSQAHIKRVSEGQDLGACIGTYARLRALLVVGTTCAFVAAVLAWERTQGFTDATTMLVILVLTARHLFEQARLGVVDTLRALRRTAMEQSVEMSETVVRVGATVLAAILFAGVTGQTGPLGSLPTRWAGSLGLEGPWDVDAAADLLAFAFFLGMFASFFVAWRHFRRLRVAGLRFDRDLARSYWRFALPMAAIAVVAVLANQMDSIMVGYFWSAREVGYYFTAQRLIMLINVLPFAVGNLFFPMMSELSAARQREGASRVARTAQRLLMLVALPVFLPLLVFRDAILHVFVGDAYLPAAPLLGLLGLHTVLLSASIVAMSVVRGFDRPRIAMAAGLSIMGSNLVLNVIMIPDSILGVPLLGLKAQGAAMATVVAQAIGMIVLLVAGQRILDRPLLGMSMLRQVAAFGIALVAFLGLDAAGALPVVDRVWELAAASLLLVALHGGILWLLRELTRKDILFFLDLVHPGKMGRYVRDELRGRP